MKEKKTRNSEGGENQITKKIDRYIAEQAVCWVMKDYRATHFLSISR